MLINQNSGSGGDAMPWYFRKARIGKLVGTGPGAGWWVLAAIHPCMDGGSGRLRATPFTGSAATGRWRNHGIAPDVPVEDLPKDFAAGHDKQLETGVQLVLDELKATSGDGDSNSALSELSPEGWIGDPVAKQRV